MIKKITKKTSKNIHCSICGEAISKASLSFDSRFAKLRHHYKSKHPDKFREMVKKSLKTRMSKK